jgi:hypothetical protein
MVTIAATRFLITAKNIDSEDLRHGAGSRIDVALPALLVLLGSSLSFICRPPCHDAVRPVVSSPLRRVM